MTNEQRIERLERRCRWLMVSLVGVVATGGVVLFCGAAQNEPAKALRAESLEIIDEAGNVRIRLGKLNSQPTLSLFGLVMKDGQGSVRVYLQDQAQLMLDRDDGRATLAGGMAAQPCNSMVAGHVRGQYCRCALTRRKCNFVMPMAKSPGVRPRPASKSLARPAKPIHFGRSLYAELCVAIARVLGMKVP